MRPTLNNLQALRGLACVAVVLYHLQQWEARLGIGMPFFTVFKWFGYAGVDLCQELRDLFLQASNQAIVTANTLYLELKFSWQARVE